jgi:DNA-binding transcriptional LysR family regulator
MKSINSTLDWENIKYFLHLADALSLDKAAETLDTSNATVMRRVKALEKQLGTTLFHRQRTGHLLTSSGARLKSRIDEASGLISSACADLSNQDKLVSGDVRITTTEVVAQWVLLPALVEFRKSVPDLCIELDVNPVNIHLNQELDTIAVRFQRPTQQDFVIRKLADITFSLYKARSLKPMSAQIPLALPHIGWSSMHEQIRLARWQSEIFSLCPPALRVSSMMAQYEACKQGLGIATLPDFIIQPKDQLLRIIQDDGQPYTLAMQAWLVIPNRIRHLSRVRTTVRMIENAFNDIFS